MTILHKPPYNLFVVKSAYELNIELLLYYQFLPLSLTPLDNEISLGIFIMGDGFL